MLPPCAGLSEDHAGLRILRLPSYNLALGIIP
jgi:hypothetical protein